MSDPIDQMLRTAGERWRQDQPPAPEPDPSRWSDRAASCPRWVPIAAAAVAVVIAAAGLSVLLRHNRDNPVEQRVGMVVRDGDTVRAAGLVLARPGAATRFCPPEVPTGTQDAPACAYGVAVTGVDLTRLASPRTAGDTRSGYADLTGVWHAGQLRVTHQGPITDDPVADDDVAPCPAPGGGWRNTGPHDGRALDAYVRQHADDFGPVWPARPAGSPVGTAPTIMVVPVVRGDPDAVRSALASRYQGSLCLVSAVAGHSIADQKQAIAVADRLLADPSSGVYGLGYPMSTSLRMVVLTDDLHRQLGDGLDPEPWLRPVR